MILCRVFLIGEWKEPGAAFLPSGIEQQGDAVSMFCVFCMKNGSWPRSALRLPIKRLSCYTLCIQRERT